MLRNPSESCKEPGSDSGIAADGNRFAHQGDAIFDIDKPLQDLIAGAWPLLAAIALGTVLARISRTSFLA